MFPIGSEIEFTSVILKLRQIKRRPREEVGRERSHRMKGPGTSRCAAGLLEGRDTLGTPGPGNMCVLFVSSKMPPTRHLTRQPPRSECGPGSGSSKEHHTTQWSPGSKCSSLGKQWPDAAHCLFLKVSCWTGDPHTLTIFTQSAH